MGWLISSTAGKFIIIAILCSIIFGAIFWYFTWSQSKIEEQITIIQQLQIKQEIQDTTIRDINTNIEKTNSLVMTYDRRIKKIADESANLRKEFNNLGIKELAKTDPVTATKLANQAMERTLTRIEDITRGVENENTGGDQK